MDMNKKLKNITSMILRLCLLTICGWLMSCAKDDVKISRPSDEPPVSLKLQFSFDEISGNTTSESVTELVYDIEGYGVNRMDGVSGNALFFDGLSNEISGFVSSSLLDNQEVVISMWLSPRAYPIGTGSMIALTQQGSSTGLMVGLNKFGKVIINYFIDGALYEQTSDEIIPRNEWSHLVIGISPINKTISVYLNQELIETGNVTSGSISWPGGNTPISIGKNTMGEMMGIYDVDYYSGGLDEVEIYSGEANQEAVDFIYNKHTAPESVAYNISIDYSGDTNRPTYHAIPDFGWANEAYGLIYLNGTYHMFYQKNEVFLGIGQQNWGHFTSSDLINWKEQNAVLWPTEGWDNFGAWSGGSIILNDGTPAVVYTGVDGVKAGIGTATSPDNYATLVKNPANPVIPGAPADVNLDFRDPFAWSDGTTYHMLVGSGISSVGGNVVYYTSNNFQNWTYEGIAFQGSVSKGEGEFWEVPIYYEFPDGKELILVQKTPDATPARTFYWIGDFSNGQFTTDFAQAKNLQVVNGFLSPTVTEDAQGRVTAIGIIPDEVDAEFQKEQGWANLFSIPQVWSLDANDNIIITPHPAIESYRGTTANFTSLSLSEGSSNYLNNYKSRHFEMAIDFSSVSADQVGFIVGSSGNGQEEYRVFYDYSDQEWVVDASNSSLNTQVRKDIRRDTYNQNQGDDLNLRVFVDGSVLEVFVNGESHFTGRFFPTLDTATGVDLFVKGGNATADVTLYEISN
jgi:sucrose-6-phosphate hydrolase SacC (GH32 family)